MQGRSVERLGRRGKYFIFELTDEVFLLVHLRMTGNLLLDPAPDTPYQRAVLHADDGQVLRFCDPRRFGTGELALGEEALDAFFAGKLGIEPLGDELDGARPARAGARTAARRSRRSCSTSATSRASGTSTPTRRCSARASTRCARRGRSSATQYDALAQAVKDVLTPGIDAGGSTIDDFRHPDGVSGAFQNDFLVHLRRGEPCLTCGTTIKKLVAAGRGTYVCESCQPRPRVRRPR